VDVRQREQHVALVGTKHKHNLVERCVSNGLLQRLIHIAGLIEVYPSEVYSSVSEHYFEQKLTKLVSVILLVVREMNIHIFGMGQTLLNEGGVPAMR